MQHSFDIQGVNKALDALIREMMPNRAPLHAQTDTLFLGGWQLGDADRPHLARFGQEKNYKVVFASFGGDASQGPVAYDVVVTDGLSQTIGLTGGRLWKRDARTAAVLLFDGVGAVVKLSTKGRMLLREMSGDHHEVGYAMAAAAVRARAAAAAGGGAVITSVAHIPVVLGVDALMGVFAAAA